MENQYDIRELLEHLGSKVSILAEENRVWGNRHNALEGFIKLLEDYISKDDWIKIYESTDNKYIKDLMIKHGVKFFPEDSKYSTKLKT